MSTPDDLLSYFPSGKVPRPEQTEALGQIGAHFQGGTPVVAFQGPTGIGKSFLGTTLAQHAAANNENVHILVPFKVLQDQYAQDFPSPVIEPIKGRTNYACSLEPWRGDASKGSCKRVHKTSLIQKCLKSGDVESAQNFQLEPSAHSCPYWYQLATAVRAPITLYNFQSFLFQQRLGRFGPRNLMILDECHDAENVLLQFVQVTISEDALRLLEVRLDLRLQTPAQVIAWLEREQIEEKLRNILGEDEATEEVAEGFSAEETEKLRSLATKLRDMRRFFDMTTWVVDVTEDPDEGEHGRSRKLRVRPIFIAPFARELLFSKAERVLAMSATILNPGIWAKNLGIAQKNLQYVEAPCPFPVANRPIILEYAGDMSWKNQPATLPNLYSTINRILTRHAGQRGIIHTHSERICKLIVENVASPRFVHLDQFPMRDKTALLRAHAQRPDSVIVASAMHEGIDLKDDLARFQIMAKIPWPMMEDAFVKARIREDKWYMGFQTALKLVQAYGRIVRHNKDHGITYVVDSGFDHFMRQTSWLLPSWFKEAVQRRPSAVPRKVIAQPIVPSGAADPNVEPFF